MSFVPKPEAHAVRLTWRRTLLIKEAWLDERRSELVQNVLSIVRLVLQGASASPCFAYQQRLHELSELNIYLQHCMSVVCDNNVQCNNGRTTVLLGIEITALG